MTASGTAVRCSRHRPMSAPPPAPVVPVVGSRRGKRPELAGQRRCCDLRKPTRSGATGCSKAASKTQVSSRTPFKSSGGPYGAPREEQEHLDRSGIESLRPRGPGRRARPMNSARQLRVPEAARTITACHCMPPAALKHAQSARRPSVRSASANSCSCLAILIGLTSAFPNPDTWAPRLPPVRKSGLRTGECRSLDEPRREE